MIDLPSPFQHPTLRVDLANYPIHQQAVRVTGGTVPGPSGYASSSILGPNFYVGFIQQLNDTYLPRDREPCFVLDLTNRGLAPGYYLGRLTHSYQSLPVVEVAGTPMPFPGLTEEQSIVLQTLSPAQLNTLNNLNPCQLQTFLTLETSDIHLLTTHLTPTQLTNLVNFSTQDEFTSLYSQLTLSQILTLTSTLNQQQIWTLVSVLTPAQIQTLITSLTTTQLQTLTTLSPADILTIVTNLDTNELTIFLNITPLQPVVPTYTTTETTGGTTILTPSSTLTQFFTGTNTQTVQMPDVSTLVEGTTFRIVNNSTGALTITSSGGNTIDTIAAGDSALLTSIATTGTGASVWDAQSTTASSGGERTEGTVAAAGTTQGTAAAITDDAVEVTGADGTKGVILPNEAAALVSVYNSAGSNLKVYPPSGAKIAGLATNAAYTMSPLGVTIFARVTSTNWSYEDLTAMT